MKLFIILLASITAINGFTFNCEFIYKHWCQVSSISASVKTKSDATITGVFGTLAEGTTTKDIKVFDIRKKFKVRYFPRQLHTYFPNIEDIYCESGLREIHKEDLQHFPKLAHLYMSENIIEVLEKDLFTYNPELTLIFFNDNNIKYVDPHIFNHLSKLTHLGFDENFCHSGKVENSKNEVLDLIKDINKDCSSSSIKNRIDQCEGIMNNKRNEKFCRVITSCDEDDEHIDAY